MRIYNPNQTSTESPLYLSLDYDRDGDPALFLVDADGRQEAEIAYLDHEGLKPINQRDEHLFGRAGLPYEVREAAPKNLYRLKFKVRS